jgi:hypothetical protein
MPDYNAVCQLFSRYAAGMDTKNFALTTETFAANARFEVNLDGRDIAPPIDGKQRIGDFFETATRRQSDQRRHVITNVRTTDEDGKQIAYAYLTLVVTTDGVLTVKQTGMLRSEIVEEAGELRFGLMQLALDGRASD